MVRQFEIRDEFGKALTVLTADQGGFRGVLNRSLQQWTRARRPGYASLRFVADAY
jgi:hypothetical protein